MSDVSAGSSHTLEKSENHYAILSQVFDSSNVGNCLWKQISVQRSRVNDQKIISFVDICK